MFAQHAGSPKANSQYHIKLGMYPSVSQDLGRWRQGHHLHQHSEWGQSGLHGKPCGKTMRGDFSHRLETPSVLSKKKDKQNLKFGVYAYLQSWLLGKLGSTWSNHHCHHKPPQRGTGGRPYMVSNSAAASWSVNTLLNTKTVQNETVKLAFCGRQVCEASEGRVSYFWFYWAFKCYTPYKIRGKII